MMRHHLFSRAIGIGFAVVLALLATGIASAGADLRTVEGDECPLFQKSQPVNGSAVSAVPTLSWSAAYGATRYEVCVDTTAGGVCDAAWTSVGLLREYAPTGLASGTTYYWQARAVTWAGPVEADFGAWWSFTILPALPEAFGKTAPIFPSFHTAPPTLAWAAGAGAVGYEYCLDAVNDGACNASWISAGTSLAVDLSGLVDNTVYYWQVRAVNAAGSVEADGGAWWRFNYRTQTFADVPVDHWAWTFVERLYLAGITGGCASSPLRYCPDISVTRGEMAIFLERGMNGSAYTPPPATGTIFADVPITYWAAAWIEKLYADGITGGCGGGNYCPSQAVTNAQMAIFLLRAKHGSAYSPPAATGTVFTDVPVSHWAAAWIEQLNAEGISTGCGGGKFCPDQPVSRAQMAVYLVRTFNLP